MVCRFLDRGQVIFPGCAARAALKPILEKGPTEPWLIGLNDVAAIIDSRSNGRRPKDAAENLLPIRLDGCGVYGALHQSRQNRGGTRLASNSIFLENLSRNFFCERLGDRHASLDEMGHCVGHRIRDYCHRLPPFLGRYVDP